MNNTEYLSMQSHKATNHPSPRLTTGDPTTTPTCKWGFLIPSKRIETTIKKQNSCLAMDAGVQLVICSQYYSYTTRHSFLPGWMDDVTEGGHFSSESLFTSSLGCYSTPLAIYELFVINSNETLFSNCMHTRRGRLVGCLWRSTIDRWMASSRRRRRTSMEPYCRRLDWGNTSLVMGNLYEIYLECSGKVMGFVVFNFYCHYPTGIWFFFWNRAGLENLPSQTKQHLVDIIWIIWHRNNRLMPVWWFMKGRT